MSFRARRGSFAKFLMQEEGDFTYENDNGRKYSAQNVYHFECAWEVANKGEWQTLCEAVSAGQFDRLVKCHMFLTEVTRFKQYILL